jgi:hypothetical protein
MEGGQLMNRLFSDFGSIDPALLTDAPFNAYINDLGLQLTEYQKGLAQVQKNADTAKVVLADANRDKAVYAFEAALKLYSLSDIPEEVEASRSLGILFGTFKKLATLNYEAETLGIDKLTGELKTPAYSDKITLLSMDRYVVRMSVTNTEFKTLFGGRIVTTAMTEAYDMKSIRTNLLDKYGDFAKYVLSMAKATDKPLFTTALNLLNTARKYYNDLLTRRTAKKPEPAK